MQIHDRINALNDRAAVLNLSLWRVCKLAGVDYGTVSRWRNNECNPTINRFSEFTTKVESQIESLEYDMAMRLIDRLNPEARQRIAELLGTPTPTGGGPSPAGGVTAGETAHQRGRNPDAEDARRSGPDRAA
jgi:hypothetical protein